MIYPYAYKVKNHNQFYSLFLHYNMILKLNYNMLLKITSIDVKNKIK